MVNINNFTTMNTTEFEIGKFYNIQPNCWSSKCVPACVKRITKRKIVFEYLYKSQFNSDGDIRKTTVDRRLVRSTPHQCAEPYDVWTTIKCTFSDDTCDKPSIWDEVK